MDWLSFLVNNEEIQDKEILRYIKRIVINAYKNIFGKDYDSRQELKRIVPHYM